MSLFMNSSGDRPSRPSQSGIHPASGATRSGGAAVEEASLVEVTAAVEVAGTLILVLNDREGAKAVRVGRRVATRRAVDEIFMMAGTLVIGEM